MMVRGPGGESARSSDATIPLPSEPGAYDPGRSEPGAYDPGQSEPGAYDQGPSEPGAHDPLPSEPGAYGQAEPGYGGSRPPVIGATRVRSRWRRLAGVAVALVAVFVLLCAIALGGLLLVTPSVGNAGALVRAQNLKHHAVYPGPQVPPRFAMALEATEDHRFTEEPGIDPIAVVRVTIGKLTGQGDQGGATLYQQLAKVLYTQGSSSPADEARQVALAVKLKFSYSQAEILRMYASVVYFGHGFYGLAAASCGYFGRSAAHLSWPQAALLAGMVQGPSADDPLLFPQRARAREEHVIGRLTATGALTSAQAAAALAKPVSRLVAHAGRGCTA